MLMGIIQSYNHLKQVLKNELMKFLRGFLIGQLMEKKSYFWAITKHCISLI